jgi:hypothetical protein
MGKAEWILLVAVVAMLVGPILAVKAVSKFRPPKNLPPAQPYKDDEED